MPIRQYDLIICDIDGCLVSEKQEAFDLDSLQTIAAHNRRSVERGDRPMVTVCSGRPQPFAESVCRMIHNLLMPAVCEMGVWVYDPGTNIYTMDPAIKPAHLEAVRELSRWAALTFGSKGVTEQPGKNASVTLYHPDTTYLREEVFPAVTRQIERMRWPFRTSMTWYYINCDLAHVSKASGLDRMLAPMNIPRARIAGIGDTIGDLGIAQRVGFFACPANAAPAIKEHAHYISPHAEAKGVVDILERMSTG